MTVFLMEEMGLHVTVKLNPTLLGKEAVDSLLRDVLGYPDVSTRPEDFDRDLQWGAMLEMTDRLVERARALGAGMENWSESFDFGLWRRALEDEGLDPAALLGEAVETVPPWHFIEI